VLGICAEALNVYPMVEENVAIAAVVVPTLL